MPAKKAATKKKETEEVKKTAEESSDEEVIEVKTTKKVEEPKEEKPSVEDAEEKEEPEKSETKDTKEAEITSFSQLDADEDKKEDETEKKEEDAEEEKTESTDQEETSEEEAKKWLKGPATEIETEGEGEKKSKLKILLIIVAIAAVLGIIAGGIYYYRSRVSQVPEEESTEPSAPTETPVTTPVPTGAEEELDLSEYSVSVLNGSGVPGEAGAVEDLLTDAGFAEFETGNADSYDYVETEVSLKEDTPVAVYNAIEEALSGTYEVSKSDSSLSEDSSFDVIVIVGAKK